VKRTAWVLALGTAFLVIVTGCASPKEPDANRSSVLSAPSKAPLSLVAIGDSIPFNSQQDCPNCTGFVDQYAQFLSKATNRKVTTTNRSEHTGLMLPGLMNHLPNLKDELSGADAIIVGIAHNSFPLNDPIPCGSPIDPATGALQDWTKVDAACAVKATNRYRPVYDELFATVSSWRAGKPSILLAINRYNDWIGFEQANLTTDQAHRTVVLHDAWNAMLCDSATASGFDCVDVYHAFNGADGSTASAGLLAADYTHPSQKGNDVIASLLTNRGFAPLV
jgi:lysophospholipase L1-like esterase